MLIFILGIMRIIDLKVWVWLVYFFFECFGIKEIFDNVVKLSFCILSVSMDVFINLLVIKNI